MNGSTSKFAATFVYLFIDHEELYEKAPCIKIKYLESLLITT